MIGTPNSIISQRKKANTIMGLRDDQGVWHSDYTAISNVAMSYFHNLFASSRPDCVVEVVDQVEAVVTPDMNETLLRPFSCEEIKSVLFQMSSSKAPGLDGMTALFFQKYWHIVGEDVTIAILDLFFFFF